MLLKVVCLKTNISTVKANATEYVEITQDTPLFLDSTQTTTLITLPKTYYAKVLSKPSENSSLIMVKYGTLTGFIDKTVAEPRTEIPPSHKEYWSTVGTLSPSSGTYLRSSAKIADNNIINLVNASSKVTVLGLITGETPTDGISNIWYLVNFEEGPTTVSRGYIYSERVTLKDEFTEQTPITEAITPEEQAGLDSTSLNTEQITGNINFSSGTKWFIIIMFSVVAVIIFALLLTPTKKSKQKEHKTSHKTTQNNSFYATNYAINAPKTDKNQPSFTVNSTTSSIVLPQKKRKTHHKINQIKPISPRALPEFSTMLEYSESEHTPSSVGPKTNTLPKSLAKYFTTSSNDELL